MRQVTRHDSLSSPSAQRAFTDTSVAATGSARVRPRTQTPPPLQHLSRSPLILGVATLALICLSLPFLIGAIAQADENDGLGFLSSLLSTKKQELARAIEDADPLTALADTPASWNLTLVNPEHHLPDGFSVALGQVEEGYLVDERCVFALNRMLEDCRAAGFQPTLISAYRDHETQETLYNQKVWELRQRGIDEESAHREAGKSVALPGTSEHQLGLAVDIVDMNNYTLTPEQADTPTQQWLMENSWHYGFILRYPIDKCDTTMITYEPWHYRYVGEENARLMRERNLCLEEFLTALESR